MIVKSNFLNWRQTGETESSQSKFQLFCLASSTLHLSYVDRRHITGAFLLAITLGTD